MAPLGIDERAMARATESAESEAAEEVVKRPRISLKLDSRGRYVQPKLNSFWRGAEDDEDEHDGSLGKKLRIPPSAERQSRVGREWLATDAATSRWGDENTRPLDGNKSGKAERRASLGGAESPSSAVTDVLHRLRSLSRLPSQLTDEDLLEQLRGLGDGRPMSDEEVVAFVERAMHGARERALVDALDRRWHTPLHARHIRFDDDGESFESSYASRAHMHMNGDPWMHSYGPERRVRPTPPRGYGGFGGYGGSSRGYKGSIYDFEENDDTDDHEYGGYPSRTYMGQSPWDRWGGDGPWNRWGDDKWRRTEWTRPSWGAGGSVKTWKREPGNAKAPGVLGLANLGNSCFANAVLQALFRAGAFPARLSALVASLEDSQSEKEELLRGFGLLVALRDIFAECAHHRATTAGLDPDPAMCERPPTESDDRPRVQLGELWPDKFMRTLRSQFDLFSGYGQQDAAEFLRFLLSHVADCGAQVERMRQRRGTEGLAGSGAAADTVMTPSQTEAIDVGAHPLVPRMPTATFADGAGDVDGQAGTEPQPMDVDAGETGVACERAASHDCRRDAAAGGPALLPDALFAGAMEISTRCLECEMTRTMKEPLVGVCVPVPATGETTMAATLDAFMESERLEGANKYQCDTCRRLTEAMRTSRFHTLPDILSIQLKRFAYDATRGSKISTPVSIPETLAIDPSLCGPSCAPETYELIAIVFHTGMLTSSGHYFSYVRSHPGDFGRDGETSLSPTDWLRIDDSEVKPADGAEMERIFRGTDLHYSTPYIALYEKARHGSPAVAPRSVNSVTASLAVSSPSEAHAIADTTSAASMDGECVQDVENGGCASEAVPMSIATEVAV